MLRLYLLIFSLLILSCRKGSESTGPSNPNNPPMITFVKNYDAFYDDFPTFAQKTSDGGFIIAGYTFKEYSGIGEYDILLIKIDSGGTVQWAKTYGGLSGYEYAHAVSETSDGGFIIVGTYIIKTDANGNIQWAKYGGDLYSVQQTNDGGYIIAGYTSFFGPDEDILLIKMDASGNVQWAKTYGGTGYDEAYAVQQTSDDGYIFAGLTTSFVDSVDYCEIFLAKTDANGNLQWFKTYKQVRRNPYSRLSLQKTNDGGYVLLYSGFLIKTDANGNVLWAKRYNTYGSYGTYSIQQTNDGGFIIGEMDEDWTYLLYSVVIKTDASGNIQWAKYYSQGGATFAQQTNDNGFIILVYRLKGDFTGDILLIKTDDKGSVRGCAGSGTDVSVYNPTLNVVNRTITTNSISITPSNISLTTTNLNLTPQDKCPTK